MYSLDWLRAGQFIVRQFFSAAQINACTIVICIGNHTVFLVQIGINLQERRVLLKTEIARAMQFKLYDKLIRANYPKVNEKKHDYLLKILNLKRFGSRKSRKIFLEAIFLI